MDLIAIDIGNSTISLGVFVNQELLRTERVSVAAPEKLAEVIGSMRQLCGAQPLGARTVPVVACSVNAKALQTVEQATQKALDQKVLVAGKDITLSIKLGVEDPEKIGADRLLTAMAAYEVVEGAVAVADFGTATTIDCVNQNGIFVGGTIMPGLGLACQALHQHTTALPEVVPEIPEGDFGTNTRLAIQHGVFYGAMGAMREIVERYATLLGQWPQLIITGGYGKIIAQKCDFADSFVPNLCLDGIYLAYRKFHEHQEVDIHSNLSQLESELNGLGGVNGLSDSKDVNGLNGIKGHQDLN